MVTGIHIPEEEILVDILTKLPVKSLLHFKCVSESWKTLISDPYFKRKHLNHAKNKLNFQKFLFDTRSLGKGYDFYCASLSPNGLVNDFRRLVRPSVSTPFYGFKVYCCCDALFLIGIHTENSYSLNEPSMLLLWNPSTSESMVLPRLGSPLQESTYGLGYDSISDDYKVLRIDQEGMAPDEILALKSGSWRKIDHPSIRSDGDGFTMFGRECLPCVHGAFHWLGFRSFMKESLDSFSISDETYGRIPLPKNVRIDPESSELCFMPVEVGMSVLREMLCLFNNNTIIFNLWIMKEYGVQESWTKLLTISSNGASLILPKYRFSNGKVLLWYEVDFIKHTIYRTSDGLTDQIWPFNCDDIDPATIIRDGFVYTESLT
ncbi:F-box/kelch-repeat protein like [Capsicum annuum]|uniref:F-box/kelch-repeat protein At3g06240-like n=1 Tax=Capsicum annuum TaxID=4072 RepID=UPI001FB0A4F2|nr:F-box/kelch-repeat protein At3g06240-like [Capsicum annuum]